MTDPIKPVSKAAQMTNQGGGEILPETQTPSSAPLEVLSHWKLASQSMYIKDQTSPLVGPDSFVSGEEVLAASLALFEADPAEREKNKLNPAQKTLEMARLDYLLGLSSSRVVAKSESNSAELQKRQEEFVSLYAAHAAELARLEKEKKKKGWKRISEFLKSVFLKP